MYFIVEFIYPEFIIGINSFTSLQMSVPPFVLDLGPLSEDAKLVAKTELRETPEVVAQGLKELRELLDADKTIYYKTDDDDFLLIFLRPTKFYAKSAYELVSIKFLFHQI